MYSTEILDDLYYSYSENDYMKNNAFWKKVDNLDINHTVLWAERLTITKHLSNDSGKDWLKMMDIIKLAKNPNIEITKKQKRFCVLTTLNYWNYLSSYYVI
jgi:hypothetical protein